MSLSYRAAQLWWNLTAEPLPDPARQEIASVISPAQCDLFYRFQDTDQWHAFRVYNTLIEAEYVQPDLLVAALLHDVGKTRVDLTVGDRMLVVILAHLMPRKADGWGHGDINSWQRPFVVRRHHPQWGADMARTAGCSELAINLIRRHQDPVPSNAHTPTDDLLRQLQWADDLN